MRIAYINMITRSALEIISIACQLNLGKNKLYPQSLSGPFEALQNEQLRFLASVF